MEQPFVFYQAGEGARENPLAFFLENSHRVEAADHHRAGHAFADRDLQERLAGPPDLQETAQTHRVQTPGQVGDPLPALGRYLTEPRAAPDPAAQFRGSYLGVASLGHRYRLLALPSQLGRGIYTVARLDLGNVWQDEVDSGDLRYGGALGLGVGTSIGPLYLAYGLADGGYNRIYFSLGTAF